MQTFFRSDGSKGIYSNIHQKGGLKVYKCTDYLKASNELPYYINYQAWYKNHMVCSLTLKGLFLAIRKYVIN